MPLQPWNLSVAPPIGAPDANLFCVSTLSFRVCSRTDSYRLSLAAMLPVSDGSGVAASGFHAVGGVLCSKAGAER